MAEWIEKQEPTIHCLRDLPQLKGPAQTGSGGVEKILHVNEKSKESSNIGAYISQMDFKTNCYKRQRKSLHMGSLFTRVHSSPGSIETILVTLTMAGLFPDRSFYLYM